MFAFIAKSNALLYLFFLAFAILLTVFSNFTVSFQLLMGAVEQISYLSLAESYIQKFHKQNMKNRC